MARIWIEAYSGQTGPPMEYWSDEHREAHHRAPTLVPINILLVSVASFTFRFFSVQQVRDCLAYYEQKHHLSSRLDIDGGDHWEYQRWFERLPMYLLEEPKRAKVVKALARALVVAEAEAFPTASSRRA